MAGIARHGPVPTRQERGKSGRTLDRLEGPVVDGLKHEPLRLLDCLRGRQRRQAATRDPRLQKPQSSRSPNMRCRAKRRQVAIPETGTPDDSQIALGNNVIGGNPRPEARSTERRQPPVRSSMKRLDAANDNEMGRQITRTRDIRQPRHGPQPQRRGCAANPPLCRRLLRRPGRMAAR